MKKLHGKTPIFLFSLITIALWITSKKSFAFFTLNPLTAASQLFSLLGLLFMMISLVLSSRLRIIEDLWGGLDKVYETHHLVGATSFILLVNHPILLAVQAIPEAQMVLQYLIPGNYLPYNTGIFALYLMLISFVFMVFIKLPYHMWKRTHQLLGFAGILGGIHSLIIGSDMASFLPLRIWMGTWIGLGSLSFVYILVFYNTLGELFVYEIKKIERFLDIINITAAPVRKKILFHPGQFAYVGFANKGISNEQHPYSFSSSPDEEDIRLSIKMLGDYTVKLPILNVGNRMILKGPYGKFGDVYNEGRKPLVWIMGGIGATPFLSMLRHRLRRQEERRIVAFYCFSSQDEGVFSPELMELSRQQKNIEVYEWCSSEKGRFSLNGVKHILEKYEDYDVQICGPGPMMESLKKQFKKIGVSEERIIYEQFQMIDP